AIKRQARRRTAAATEKTAKRTAAAVTMLGPEGVSSATDPEMPSRTAIMPKRAAEMAMLSGEETSWRAVAAGMISIDVISRIPTMRIETATTMVISSIRRILAQTVF